MTDSRSVGAGLRLTFGLRFMVALGAVGVCLGVVVVMGSGNSAG